MSIDREQLETTSLAVGIVAAVWAFFKWLVTPLVLTSTRTALAKEIEALTKVTEALAAIVARIDGHERRIQMLEDRE